MRGPDVSIVVPVFNNAATLDELIDRIVRVLEANETSFELIMVDDASTDHSYAILRHRAAADPRLRTISLIRNSGGNAARCAGFDLARGDRVVCLDADLENDPDDIPVLLAALDRGYDLVCGVRHNRPSQRWRRFASRLFNSYARRQLGTAVHDLGCGMRAMDASVVQGLAAEGDARRFLTPLLLRRAQRITEVPIRGPLSARSSRYTFLTLVGVALDFYLVSARRPFLMTGLSAAAAFGVGLMLALVAAFKTSLPLLLLGAVLAVGGALGALLSLMGEFLQRVYQLHQGIPFYELRPQAAPELESEAFSVPERTRRR